MVAVGYPWLRAVQQGGEYDGSIDADLSALVQMLAVPVLLCRIYRIPCLLLISLLSTSLSILASWYTLDKGTDELLSAQFHRLWCKMGGTLLGVQVGEGTQSSSSWPRVQRAGQSLQSEKLGVEGIFRCGQRGQRCQWRGGHQTAPQMFLCGHAVTWG